MRGAGPPAAADRRGADRPARHRGHRHRHRGLGARCPTRPADPAERRLVRDALQGLTTRGRSFVAAGLAVLVAAVGDLAEGPAAGRRSCCSRCRWSAPWSWRGPATGCPPRRRLGVGAHRRRPGDVGDAAAGQHLPAADRACCWSRTTCPTSSAPGRGSSSTGSSRAAGARSPTPCAPTCAGATTLGPLSIRLTDPFGMCELQRSFSSRDTLVVTPPVQHAAGRRALRRVDGQRREPVPVARQRRRGRRRHPRVPPGRRPAPGALALDRAARAS